MRVEEIMGLMALTALVIIPALAITARFAMKPIVESILQLRKAFNEGNTTHDSAEIELLQREITELRRDVELLKREREFDKALRPASNPLLADPDHH